MAEIKFDNFSQQFDRVYRMVHLIGLGLSIVFAIFSIFIPNHFLFFPAIFFIGFVLFGLSFYKRFFIARKNKGTFKTSMFFLIVALILAALTVFSVLCFW